MDPLTVLLADSRFPSGSYAHSLGLEQAVRDGLRDVPAFIRARQRLVAEADARFAVEARRAAEGVASGRELATAPLERLDIAWAARCPSPALRSAARRLGAQLLRTAAITFRGPAMLAAWPRAGAAPPHAAAASPPSGAASPLAASASPPSGAASPLAFGAAAIVAYRSSSRLTP